MSVIRQICDRVAVMYLGEIVEIGPVEEIFTNPQHPYTEALLSSIPTPDPRASVGGIELKGTVPSPTNPPSGCRFHTRCHKVIQPDGVDVDQEDWRGLLNFRDKVNTGEIDVEQVRENVAASGTEPTSAEIQSEIRREFDIGETVDDPELERTLSEALDLLIEEDEEQAGSILSDAITTPCAESVPQRTAHTADHESACLLHGERAPAEPNPADD
jgi:peptide/nickel transport system ATP-binding protein